MITRNSTYEAFLELNSMPQNLGQEDAKKRGEKFEDLILELFDSEMLLRKKSYHTSDNKSEQIDGALKIGGIRALLEVKWVSSGLAASALYAFLGKVEGKFVGTIGIFISRVELSQNFLKSLRSGRRQCVIVIHGEDVDNIFNPKFPIKEYLISTLDNLSFDNQFHFSAGEFLRKLNRSKNINKNINPLVNKALECKDYTNIINEWVDDIDNKSAAILVESCLDVFLRKKEIGGIGSIEQENLNALLFEGIKKLSKKEEYVDWLYYDELSINFIESPFSSLIKYFSIRYDKLNEENKKIFTKRLVKQWKNNVGDYESENKLADITDPIWKYLDNKTQDSLLRIFLSFIDSGRIPAVPDIPSRPVFRGYEEIGFRKLFGAIA